VESRKVTLEVWLEAVEDQLGNAIEQVDRPRLVAGFRYLEKNCTDWPKPKDLFEHMPPRPRRESLSEPPPNEEAIARGKRYVRDILTSLDNGHA
jgi:hypothetical protein